MKKISGMKIKEGIVFTAVALTLGLGACGSPQTAASQETVESVQETSKAESTISETQEEKKAETAAETSAALPEFAIETEDIKVVPYKNLGMDLSQLVRYQEEPTEIERKREEMGAILNLVVSRSVLLNSSAVEEETEKETERILGQIERNEVGMGLDTVEKYCEFFRIEPANEEGLRQFIGRTSEYNVKRTYVSNAIMEKEGLQLTDEMLQEFAKMQECEPKDLDILGEDYLNSMMVSKFIYENN